MAFPQEIKVSSQNAEDSYPLSSMQEHILLRSHKAPYSGVFVQQLIGTLREKLDVSAFQQAWQQVMGRHAALRTSLHWPGMDKPVQKVHQEVALPLVEQDWQGLSAREQANRLQSYLRTDRRRGFEFTDVPLMRLALFRMGVTDYTFVWSFHRALLDDHSCALVLRDLFAVYEALCQLQGLGLDQPRPYRDYIDWLGKQDLSQAERFWRRLLAGFTAPTPLVVDRAIHTKPDAEEGFQRQSIHLSEGLTSGLHALAEDSQLTASTILLGAWALLLSRYSGEQDVVFGATRSCRRSAFDGQGADAIVGPVVNTLPLRAHVPPAMSLLPWLKELQSRWDRLQDYEHTPLVKIQEWSDVPPGECLFDSTVDFKRYSLTSFLREQGSNWENRDFQLIEAPLYPLAVTVNADAQLQLTIAYDSHRFDDATVVRMLGHVETLLQAMAADPGQALSELPLLTEAERRQILVEWNNTSRTYPRDRCIHQLFEAQVERTPDHIAVVFEDEHLTYDDLNRRANQLAHFLRKLGVGTEVLVAICVERSVDMVVGLLGILKAGAAYVPLDPAHPSERLALMLEDTQAPVLLTQTRLLSTIPDARVRVICMDADWEAVAQESQENPIGFLDAKNLAYVMYTSGSTGRPKGIAIPHQAVSRLVCNTDYLRVEAADRVAQASNSSFDAATFEIWGALVHGACLVGLPTDVVLSLADFADQLRERNINVLFLTTALFNQLAATFPWAFRSLRDLLFGGEAVDPRRVREVLQRGAPERLLHVYGPTESTTFASWYLVREVEPGATTVPIGKPVANTQIYLLDKNMQPVPVGVPGELHIGGDGLARAYLHLPRLTAERFLPNPFSDEPGARLYATGDLARQLPDGSIEFVGRVDHQVKIRGFRVEPGEIETVMSQHPTVGEVVVLAREDTPGDRRLVAYVVRCKEQLPTSSELREFVQKRVPDYMVPTAFVFLDALPLTPNGKVDRRALPAPDRVRPDLAEPLVPPRTPVEELLASIWTRVLGLEDVGIYDSFFDLGGHSLALAQTLSRVREQFEVDVPFARAFETPTIAGLATAIRQARASDRPLVLPPLEPVPRAGPIPLSFAQEQVWFLQELAPGNLAYNFQALIHFKGPLKLAILNQALTEVVRRHEILRTSFNAVNGQPAQVIHPPWTVEVPVVDLSLLAEDQRESEIERLAWQAFQQPFDTTRLPLLRWTLLKLDPQYHILIQVEHHFVHDGWSFSTLLDELQTLYEAFSAERPSPLPELPVQFADFAVWQRKLVQGDILKGQLSYWKDRLVGSPPILELPTDRPRPAFKGFQGAAYRTKVSTQLYKALKALSLREGVTLFMTMLAAFKLLLWRYTGQTDLLVGSGVANRRLPESEHLLGMIVNTVVLRTDLSGNPTFQELLRRVREVTLDAYAHQDLPFERLVHALQPRRDLSRNPLFQVMFAFHDSPVPELKFSGLTGTIEYRQNDSAKFDLNVVVIPRAEQLMSRASQGEGAEVAMIWEYDTALFDASTIARMAGHYHTLLESIVANPQQPISALPILAQPEQHQLLVQWNDTRTHYPSDCCIHQLFEAQVEQTPDNIALVFQDQQLTYRDLNRRANQLAHFLQEVGVAPEVPVGICSDRSLEMVIALLAILKAGGAYVPLDPSYPPQRLAFLIQDTRLPLLLTESHLQHILPHSDARLLSLDADWAAVSQQRHDNPLTTTSPDNLAYVMYTSGSTGQPKGVTVTHRGVVRLVKHTNYAQLTPDQVFLHFSPLSFDASTFEIWAPLLNGAQLVIFPSSKPSLHELGQVLLRDHITTLWLTAGLFHQMVDHHIDSLQSLQQLLAGGDVVSPTHVKHALQHLPRCTLINGYGPTENTTFSCCHPMSHPSQVGNSTPIGRPIANTQALILDHHLNPVPIGVTGELYVGGDGLARGYLQRPDLTAQHFVPHPFSNTPGARLYRTGDLARYRPDGTIDFLGRIDNQVKIRGFRIELGEIEATLSQHPQVRKTVVLARGDLAGEKRLVAYVVTNQDAPPTISELQRFLRERMPDYMVPSAFVMLDQLPLTPIGKVDRRALPAPGRARPQLAEPPVPPRTPIEELLASIWREVLGLQQVGIHDDFFELGGHSLIATQVLSRVRSAIEVNLPLRRLFQAPTIAQLARAIEEAGARRTETPGSDLPPLAEEAHRAGLSPLDGKE